MTLEEYLNMVLASYVKDPVSTEFQRGHLSALIDVRDQLCDPAAVPLPDGLLHQTNGCALLDD